MNRNVLLRNTITLVRAKDAGAFENFYILTVQKIYEQVCGFTGDRKEQEELLLAVYQALYRQAESLPLEEESLFGKIEQEIFEQAEKQLKTASKELSPHGKRELSEEDAAGLWIRLEECLGLDANTEDKKREAAGGGVVLSCLKIAFSVLVLAVTVFILYKSFFRFYEMQNQMKEKEARQMAEESEEETEAQIFIEKEKTEPGWERKPDGKLYYVKKDGTLADGTCMIGKQLLTFSRKGELTLIGQNKEVSGNENLSFDEDVCYEVKNGDLYRRNWNPEAELKKSGRENFDGSGEVTEENESGETTDGEVCIVRNGHIVQADIRCGVLWYMSQYQIPNSDQVRTVLYKADPDGERAEEIFATDSILDADWIQITGGYMYYLSDRTLFRKELKTDRTELLAEDVEYYFAWENMAFYMRERTLEMVSEGKDYSGLEAGYRIEFDNEKFILFNSDGEQVKEGPGGSVQIGDRIYSLKGGAVSSVKPAPRESKDAVYYIHEAGSDRKIYWKNSGGVQGLIHQEGLYADSLCIAGEWLYYSARTAEYGDEIESQMYRINLDSMELEEIGERFRGFMKNLYYFEQAKTIYGEYIPSVADPEDIHGKIAEITPEGDIRTAADTSFRENGQGSDLMELVMVSGNRVYGFYHLCRYDRESGSFEWKTTKPVVIELPKKRNRSF